MSKELAELKPNYAPVYAAAMYPELAAMFQQNGYALAVHGSLAHDLDLIAVPWVKDPQLPVDVLVSITSRFAIQIIGEATVRNHGRICYTLSVGFGQCAIDLSFMPMTSLGPSEHHHLRHCLTRCLSALNAEALAANDWKSDLGKCDAWYLLRKQTEKALSMHMPDWTPEPCGDCDPCISGHPEQCAISPTPIKPPPPRRMSNGVDEQYPLPN